MVLAAEDAVVTVSITSVESANSLVSVLLEQGSLVLRDVRGTPGEKFPDGQPYLARVSDNRTVEAAAYGRSPLVAVENLVAALRDKLASEIEDDERRRRDVLRRLA